jgi:hypothetical protein
MVYLVFPSQVAWFMLVHPDIAPLNSPVSGPGDLWRVDERPGGTAILGDGVEGGDCSTLVSDMGHVLMVDYGYPAVMKHGWKIHQPRLIAGGYLLGNYNYSAQYVPENIKITMLCSGNVINDGRLMICGVIFFCTIQHILGSVIMDLNEPTSTME